MYLRGAIMSLLWCGLNHQRTLQLAQSFVLLAFSRDRPTTYGLRSGFMLHARMMCIKQSGDLVSGCCSTVNELVWRKLVLARNHCGILRCCTARRFCALLTFFQNTTYASRRDHQSRFGDVRSLWIWVNTT
jgi:hypothetical protein